MVAHFLTYNQPLLSAVTESRPKVTYHIQPKPYVLLKVKGDFRPKPKVNRIWADMTIEASKSHPVSIANYPVHLISFTFSPIMSAVRCVIRPQGPTVPDADVDNAAASSV